MTKTRILPISLFLISMLLTSCNTPAPEKKDFKEKLVPVFNFNQEKGEDALCRFYDELSTVPYIDINSYYKLLLNKEVKLSKVSDGVYLIETYKGSATIDVENDILHSDDYNQFINTTIYRSENAHNVYYDNAPYLKVGKYHATDAITPKTIDFKKYKIDFKYDDSKIWAPLITFSDMFKGVTMIQTFYNGENIYLMDSNNLNVNPPFYTSNYYDGVFNTYYKNNQRDPKVAELSYLEMCFNLDNYFGYPGRSPLEQMMKEKGLDYTLENYSDSTRITKNFLLSTDIYEYVTGMIFLGNLLQDGGHTVIDYGASLLLNTGRFDDSAWDIVKELAQTCGYEYIYEEQKVSSYTFRDIRESVLSDDKFNSKDDTFIYSFDEFMIDYDAWNDFYDGKRKSYPTDAVGNFNRAIELAKADPNIKNFIIDLSANLGGFGDVVMYLMAAVANKPSIYHYDYIDKRNVKQDYIVDVNLDGNFDELDNQKIADFNFGILTSEASFSCGNLLPALAKDNGIPLLGGKSGGGACAVLDSCSMEGIYYRTSSFVHLTNSNFETIDSGLEVNCNLYDETFSKLYNIDLISEFMNQYYA